MILHTVNKPPIRSDRLKTCLRLLAPGDALLLIEDGTYAADRHFQAVFDELPEGVALYGLKADIDARGLASRVSDRIAVIDEEGFVDLAVRADKSQAWY